MEPAAEARRGSPGYILISLRRRNREKVAYSGSGSMMLTPSGIVQPVPGRISWRRNRMLDSRVGEEPTGDVGRLLAELDQLPQLAWIPRVG